MSTLDDFAIARDILGDDFLAPDDIAAASGLSYSLEQIAEFARSLPSMATLRWLMLSGFMLVAGPPSEMSLLDIRDFYGSYFYNKEDDWYANRIEAFARIEKVAYRWYMICKGIVTDSARRHWSQQLKLFSDFNTAPTAVELVWALTAYKAVRDVCLLSNDMKARTWSVDSRGFLVCVMFDDKNGILIDSSSASETFCRLGVAAIRKF